MQHNINIKKSDLYSGVYFFEFPTIENINYDTVKFIMDDQLLLYYYPALYELQSPWCAIIDFNNYTILDEFTIVMEYELQKIKTKNNMKTIKGKTVYVFYVNITSVQFDKDEFQRHVDETLKPLCSDLLQFEDVVVIYIPIRDGVSRFEKLN